jgi:hypothetical protein
MGFAFVVGAKRSREEPPDVQQQHLPSAPVPNTESTDDQQQHPAEAEEAEEAEEAAPTAAPARAAAPAAAVNDMTEQHAAAPNTESTDDQQHPVVKVEVNFFFSDRVKSFLASTFGLAIGIAMRCARHFTDDIHDCDDDVNAVYIRDKWLEVPVPDDDCCPFSIELFKKELEDPKNHERIKNALMILPYTFNELWKMCDDEEAKAFAACYGQEKIYTFSQLVELK